MNKLYLSFLLLMTWLAHGQDKPIRSVPLKGDVAFAAVDRPGDLYVIMSDGLIRKFDKDGKEIATKKYSVPPTLFDPRDGTLSFAYFRDSQKLNFLAPDMSSVTERDLNPEFAISAWLVCPSKNEMWILDSADFSLKQTKERGESIAYDVAWNGDKSSAAKDIVFMREYLNFLFILDREKGLYMFNHLGKLIRHINEKNIGWFSFLGEELYYPKSKSLHCIDLYTGEERDIQLPKECSFALLTDERMILVEDQKIEFLSYKP